MSVEHIAAVLHHSRATGTAKLVLIGIANHAGDGGSWPTVATLARYAGVDRSNARKAIQRLEALGEVARHIQQGGTRTSHEHDIERPNLYEVLVACPEGCDGSPQHRPRKGYRRLQDGTYEPVDTGEAVAPPLGDSAPPPLGGSAPLTTHSTPDEQVVSQVQDAREAEPVHNDAGVRPLDERRCQTCSAPDERACLRRQMRLDSEHRHPYDPVPFPVDEGSLAPQGVGAAAEDGPDVHDTDRAGNASSADPAEEV